MTTPATIPQCPLCTTILHNEDRRKAMLGNLARVAAVENEHLALTRILFSILREHGGEIAIRRLAATEDVTEHPLLHRKDEEGNLVIALPPGVLVEGLSLIRSEV
jgi:hypothetical protein